MSQKTMARFEELLKAFDERISAKFPSVPQTARGRIWIDPTTGTGYPRSAFYVRVEWTNEEIESAEYRPMAEFDDLVRGKLEAAERIMTMMVEAAQPLASLGAPMHILTYVGTPPGRMPAWREATSDGIEVRLGGYLVSKLLSGFPFQAAPLIR